MIEDKGILFLCGTPIGNLDDTTIRLVKTLKSVDVVACEDTRRTRKLLNYLEIKVRLVSLHEHNEAEKSDYLLDLLLQGKDIALVSDAGMPLISDPGNLLVEKAIKEGIEIVPVPGPTALISALVVSGLPSVPFVFEGFLPRKRKERKEKLRKLIREKRTMVFYEAPHRMIEVLEDMKEIMGSRKACVVRELTKKHEEKLRGTLDELYLLFSQKQKPRGEFVLVVEGQKEEIKPEALLEVSIAENIRLLMEAGLTKKEAIKKVAKERNLPKREVYKEAVKINVNQDNL